MGRGSAVQSVCYANPALLLRRPISELLALQEGKRALGLLITAKGVKHEKELHHTTLFKKAKVQTYRSWHPPGPFAWPIPGPKFFKQGWKTLSEYDIVHAWAHFYPSTLLLMLKALMRRKTKIILTMDALPGYSYDAGSLMNFAFKIYTWTLGRIVYGVPDVITLYGEALLPYAKKSGINMKKVHVIPTGIMPHKVPSRTTARRTIAKELAIPKGKRIVLYAGLINPRKRVEDVLAVAEQRKDLLFLIAGEGPSRKQLEQQAPANVRFLGWRNDLLTLMRAADVFLFPSSAEGLPGVVMEAMYCETPVVTTRIPCTTDLITHRKEGLLCDVHDTVAMRRALDDLEDKKLTAGIVKRAKKKISTTYNWKHILPQYEQLYQ